MEILFEGKEVLLSIVVQSATRSFDVNEPHKRQPARVSPRRRSADPLPSPLIRRLFHRGEAIKIEMRPTIP